MIDISHSRAIKDTAKPIGLEGAKGATPQSSDAMERNAPETKPSHGTHFEDRAASGIVTTPTLTASLLQPTSLDLANFSLPKIETRLSVSSQSAQSSKILADESAKLHQAAEKRSDFFREHFPFGKSTYDYYFSASGVIRDTVELLTHGVGWMSGFGVAGTSLAVFGLAPVPFFGGAAAGIVAYQAIQFMGRGLTGVIWGKDGLR